MAINKKGSRKIIINNEIYYYRISQYNGRALRDWLMTIVIEYPNGSVKIYQFEHEEDEPFTPKDVRKLIEGQYIVENEKLKVNICKETKYDRA